MNVIERVKEVMKKFQLDASKRGLKVETTFEDIPSSDFEELKKSFKKISPDSVIDNINSVFVKASKKEEIVQEEEEEEDEIVQEKEEELNEMPNKYILSIPERKCFDNIIESCNKNRENLKNVKTISDTLYERCIKDIDISNKIVNGFINKLKEHNDDKYKLIIDYVTNNSYNINEDKFGIQIKIKYLKVLDNYNDVIDEILNLKHTHSNSQFIKDDEHIYNICDECIHKLYTRKFKLKIKSNIKCINKIINDINVILIFLFINIT